MSVAVSQINKAAYALEKSSMALLYASTANAKAIAQEHYEAACAELLRLLPAPSIKIRKAA